jgi:hypothetical protein
LRRHAPTPEQQLSQARELEARYYAALSAPSFAIFADKIDLHEIYAPDKDPCAAIREDRIPTAEESVSLRQWAEMRASYEARILAVITTEPSGSSQTKSQVARLDALEDNGLRTQTVLISNLADGRLTYCQFATLDKALTQDIVRQAAALRRSMREERQMLYNITHRDIGSSSVLW